jgi:hypothetical protein
VWDPIQNVTPLGTSVFDPKLGVDADGTVTAVWVRSSGGTRVQTAVRPAITDTWFPAAFLSSADYAASSPDVAVSPSGSAHAIWLQTIAGKDVAFAASRVSGAWGVTQQASIDGQDAAGPTIIVDSSGIKHAAWSRQDANGDFIVQSVHAADPTGNFVAMANLSAAGENAFAARLVAGPKGLIAAIWIRDSGAAKLLEARTTRDPIVGWGDTTTISTPALIAAHHGITIDGSDNATAVWLVSNGANDIARVRVFDSAPPAVLDMRTPATAVVGEPVVE